VDVAISSDKKDIAYEINIEDNSSKPINTVMRRFWDFENMHEKLCKTYSKARVAELPPKKLYQTPTQTNRQERMLKLEVYLNKISLLEGVVHQDGLRHFMEGEMIVDKKGYGLLKFTKSFRSLVSDK